MHLSIFVKHWLYVSHCGRHRHAQVIGKVTVPTLIKYTVCMGKLKVLQRANQKLGVMLLPPTSMLLGRVAQHL